MDDLMNNLVLKLHSVLNDALELIAELRAKAEAAGREAAGYRRDAQRTREMLDELRERDREEDYAARGQVVSIFAIYGHHITDEDVARHCGPKRIEAIKHWRTLTGLGLKDAKEAMDDAYERVD